MKLCKVSNYFFKEFEKISNSKKYDRRSKTKLPVADKDSQSSYNYVFVTKLFDVIPRSETYMYMNIFWHETCLCHKAMS